MDIIDDVIRHLGLRSRIAYRYEYFDHWDSEARNSSLMQLHCVLNGSCRYRLSGVDAEQKMQQGDVLLLPHGGDLELLGSPKRSPQMPGVDSSYPTNERQMLADAPRLLILGLDVELAGHHHHPLFGGLPDTVLIDRRSFLTSGTREHAGYLIAKTGTLETGTESAIIDRLVEILLIQTIKAYYAAEGSDASFLPALHDPAIGRAIAAIHKSPGHNWNLERLADESGLSRSAFSRRFTDLTGVPAMHYLTAWRMQLALQKIRSGRSDMPSVAQSVGYLSPAAFQKAFKRVHGYTPAQAATAAI